MQDTADRQLLLKKAYKYAKIKRDVIINALVLSIEPLQHMPRKKALGVIIMAIIHRLFCNLLNSQEYKLKARNLATVIMATLLLSNQAIEAGPKEIRQKLQQSMPGLEVTSIRPTPIKGVFEVAVGMQVAYVSSDGDHLIIGKLIEVKSKKNLTESRQEEILGKLVNSLGTKDMIVIKPRKVKRSITVFTDVDCPYCSKLHKEVPKLTKAGVSVQYLLYPRNGPRSPTFRKSVSVWCADDQIKAIGDAKQGIKIEQKDCENPVMKNFKLGRRIGITGTPTIILDSGKMLGGYLPADHILQKLELSKK